MIANLSVSYHFSSMRKVSVIGGGVLGSQIAFQAAYKGFDTIISLPDKKAIQDSKPKLERLHGMYHADLDAAKKLIGTNNQMYSHGLIQDLAHSTVEKVEELKQQVDKALESVKFETDMELAFNDRDIVIECITENKDAKIGLYKSIANKLPEKTILTTNSSTLLPSAFAEYTGRPDRFLAMHFANEIWRFNIAEIMGHPGTDPEAYNKVVKFAGDLGMIPLQLKKEQPGYILNSMLVPFLFCAQALNANEIADPKTIDTTWKISTGATKGPFEILDIVGLDTAFAIQNMNPLSKDPKTVNYKILNILRKKLSEGKRGIATGEGFYKYK